MDNILDLDSKSLKGVRKYLEFQKIEPKTINELFRNSVKYRHAFYERNGVELTT